MIKTKVVLSFDDGRKDNFDKVIPMLCKFDMYATFNISTSFVDRSIKKEDSPCPNEAMTIENVRKMYSEGHEIAAHGDCHKNDFEDIAKGIKKMREWGVAGKKIGFASPHSGISEQDILKNAERFKGLGISYVRIGVKKNDFFTRVQRKLSGITGNAHLYCNGFDCGDEKIEGRFIIHSVPIMHNATLEQVKGIVMQSVQRNSDCVLMFHSILKVGEPYYNDDWSWDYNKFVNLCKWLAYQKAKGDIRIGHRG